MSVTTQSQAGMVLVPGGEFLMGVSRATAKALFTKYYAGSESPISPGVLDAEMPEHRVRVAPFRLQKTEVTNAEFKEFLDAGGYAKKECWAALVAAERLDTYLEGFRRVTLFVDASGRPGPASWK